MQSPAPRRWAPFPALCRALRLASALLFASVAQASDWAEALDQQVQRIEKASTGEIGVYIKRLDSGETYSHRADRAWYLSSSAKVPIAIAVLQDVQAGRLSLTQEIELQATDKIDGSGDLVWQENGSRYPVDSLLKRMLGDSDNTGANMLIRAVGVDNLNQRSRRMLGRGFEEITTFTRIRQDVYAELHPSARELSNLELVQVAGSPLGPQRVEALRRAVGMESAALQVQTIDEAYARYYARGLNSATLQGYGAMLEQLVRGRLLSPELTTHLYTDMKFDTYDAYRLEAGLPRSVKFIHKTGTQFQRACHMGVIDPQDGGRNAIIVATCAQDLDESRQAGRAFEELGEAITRTLLTPERSR